MVDLKVGNRNNVDSTLNEAPKRPANTPGDAAETSTFRASISAANRQILEGDLQQMLDQVRSLGENFLRSPDEKKLLAYKEAVGTFLARVTKETFTVRQEVGDMKDGRQKVYQLVETVKGDIDALTKETLQKDKALKLLGSLDDIRGLVLDLFT